MRLLTLGVFFLTAVTSQYGCALLDDFDWSKYTTTPDGGQPEQGCEIRAYSKPGVVSIEVGVPFVNGVATFSECPDKLSIKYALLSEQGSGKIFDFRKLPVLARNIVFVADTFGPSFLCMRNPTEEVLVNIVAISKETTKVQLQIPSFQLNPSEQLCWFGLPSADQKQLSAETLSGKTVTIDLL